MSAVQTPCIQSQQLNLSEEQFNAIRSEIADLVSSMHPARSHQNIEQFWQATQSAIQGRGFDPKLYWEEVWKRGGCKDVLDYNETHKKMGSNDGPISLETHRALVQTLTKVSKANSAPPKVETHRSWGTNLRRLLRRKAQRA